MRSRAKNNGACGPAPSGPSPIPAAHPRNRVGDGKNSGPVVCRWPGWFPFQRLLTNKTAGSDANFCGRLAPGANQFLRAVANGDSAVQILILAWLLVLS